MKGALVGGFDLAGSHQPAEHKEDANCVCDGVELLREGFTVADRYNRQQLAAALGPVVENCMRQIRDGKIRVFNLFAQRRR